MHTPALPAWDSRYEFKAVALLALGFGLVGLDRMIIYPLFPVISRDLGLGYQDLGLISAVLALTWGIASIFAGQFADRVGHKRIMVPAVVAFSIMVAGSGLAGGLLSLLLIRAAMGVAEGAFVTPSIVATIQASKPSRIGLNVGLQQLCAPLFGMALGPIIAVSLIGILPSWKWVFGIVAIPGLILAIVMQRVLREDGPTIAPQSVAQTAAPWKEVLRHSSLVYNILCVCCYLGCLVVMSAFMPSYLTDYLKLSLDQMGLVLSGMGAGSIFGLLVLPTLSDRLGRKPVIVAALVVQLIALGMLIYTGPDPYMLFGLLFAVICMDSGVIAITVGPLTNASVPRHLAATATGLVVGLGEVFGGALAPAIAGVLTQNLGITLIPKLAFIVTTVGLILAGIGIREPKHRPALQPV